MTPANWTDWGVWSWLILAAGSAVVGAIAARLILAAARKFRPTDQGGEGEPKTDLTGLAAPLRLLVPVLIFFIGLGFIQTGPELTGGVKTGLSIAVIWLVAWLLARLAGLVESAAKARFRVDVPDNLKARRINTKINMLKRVTVVIIAVIAFASTLMVFDRVRQLGMSILASAGIAGIILGFAAQKSLGLLLAGLQVAITQPIRLDDVVVVQGEWGRIEEITMTYVVVRIWDERRLVLPINYFIEQPFQNWTRTGAEILGTVFLRTDYTAPVDELRAELTRILESSDWWDGRVNSIR